MSSARTDTLWYKDAIIYELHVRAFSDHDGDGVGDFKGLTRKLDYLQELGVTALWLLPFYPSPLRDDGYDIADYHGVHPLYGVKRDFEIFLKEAHLRGLKVITELVVNHTSDQHAWFQRARRAAPGSKHRNFYVWNKTQNKYKDARIIFRDFEHSNWTYDSIAKAYYWHRFYAHQPDLNFANPAVKKAVFQVMDSWFDLGVDGMRLDAVPYLIEKEGTDCENLPETHQVLKELRRHLDRRYSDKLLLAEANQWPEDAAAYFGDGDECHMNFHFPLMPRLFMSLHMEDRHPIIDILEQTPEIHPTSQWALFLRNHDELTLEMVTDEERDYMYRVYAESKQMRVNLGIRRRLAPLLGNNRRRIELMNALLLSLPGTPVLYYGDELGMGDNHFLGDRNGVRTPMQWSSDRNAGFSRANPQSLYLPVIIDPEYHYESVNVEAQLKNTHSLLWWMKRIIALRKRRKAFGRGTIEFLYPENRKILSFVRKHESESVVVVANLSRYAQFASLDLSGFTGLAPVEMFGRTEFPSVSSSPYLLTMAPHSFYWFSMERPAAAEIVSEAPLPSLVVERSWERVLEGSARESLEEALPAYIKLRRWFGGKARRIEEMEIADTLPLPLDGRRAHLALVSVAYTEGQPETYLLPLAFASGAAAEQIGRERPHEAILKLTVKSRRGSEEGLLYDAAFDPELGAALLESIDRRRSLSGTRGEALCTRTPLLRGILGRPAKAPKAAPCRAEQSNTSVVFGDQVILKLFRRIEEGVNPEVELGQHLSLAAGFEHAPPLAGFIDYQRGKETRRTLGILHGYVRNQGDAWQFTLDQVSQFLERAASRYSSVRELPPAEGRLMDLARGEAPELARETIGVYSESARLLGRRTAEMHLALGSGSEDPAFVPEPFTPFYRRSLYQSMRNLTAHVFQLLRKQASVIPAQHRDEARKVSGLAEEITGWFGRSLKRRIAGVRIRIHGDFHLGQVMYTGKDFVIIDFEGEPARGIGERRLKRSPLRDVAGMIRSFHYAAVQSLAGPSVRRLSGEGEVNALAAWARMWHQWVAAAYLRAYLEIARPSSLFEGSDDQEIATMLDVFRLEKAIYELCYELNNRPEWVGAPLAGILELFEEAV